MYFDLFATDLSITLLLLLISLLAAWSIGRGPRQASACGLRRNARMTQVFLGLSAALGLAKVATSALFLTYGWAFAATRLVLDLPLLVLAAVAVAILALPRLQVLARHPIAERRSLCTET